MRLGVAREIDRAPRQLVSSRPARMQPRGGRPAAPFELEHQLSLHGIGPLTPTLPHAGRPFLSVRGSVLCLTVVACFAGGFGAGPWSHAATNATTASSFVVLMAKKTSRRA